MVFGGVLLNTNKNNTPVSNSNVTADYPLVIENNEITQVDTEYTGDITIPDTVTSIGANAFLNCNNIDFIKMPNTNQITLKDSAFKNSSIKTLLYDGTILFEGTSHFEDCSNFEYIKFSTSITIIPENILKNTAIRCIEIPASVTNIGNNAFNGCSYLESIRFHGVSPPSTIGSNIFLNIHASADIIVPDTSTAYGTSGSTYNGVNVIKILSFSSTTYDIRFEDTNYDTYYCNWGTNAVNKWNKAGKMVYNESSGASFEITETFLKTVIQASFGPGITAHSFICDNAWSGTFTNGPVKIVRYLSLTDLGAHALMNLPELKLIEIPTGLNRFGVWAAGSFPKHYLPYDMTTTSSVTFYGGGNNIGNPSTYEIIAPNMIYMARHNTFRGFQITLFSGNREMYTTYSFSNTNNVYKIIIEDPPSSTNANGHYLYRCFRNLYSLRELVFEGKLPNTWVHYDVNADGTVKWTDTFNKISHPVKIYYNSSLAFTTYSSRTDRGGNNHIVNLVISNETELINYLNFWTSLDVFEPGGSVTYINTHINIA